LSDAAAPHRKTSARPRGGILRLQP
jgi:hypothetical protein